MNLIKVKNWCKENVKSILIIFSAIFGMSFGFILKSIWTISPVVVMYIGLPGKLIIRAFMMIIAPMIVSSLALSIIGKSTTGNKRLILVTFLLTILFSSCSSTFGMIIMYIIKPGVKDMSVLADLNNKSIDNINPKRMTNQEDALYDVLMNLIPDNIIAATFMSHYTALVPINANNITLGYKKVEDKAFRPNILGLSTFALILGFAILKLESKAQNVKKLLQEINDIVMNIIGALHKLMAIAMFSWMFVLAINMKSPEHVVVQIVWFLVTIILAFLILWFLIYPTIYFLFLRKNPFIVYRHIMPALIVAFASSSSALTLPTTMKCMEENYKLSKQITQFVLPLTMTINMNGAAMYFPMVIVFGAQLHGLNISFQLLITLWLVSLLISITAPGTPSGGSTIVNFIAFCTIIGIEDPMEILAYTMIIDWVIERFRTLTNVMGDCFLSAIAQNFVQTMKRKNEI